MIAPQPLILDDTTSRGWIGWGGVLLAVYLGLSAIYWLPGVSVTALSVAKLGIVGAAVFAVFAFSLAKESFALPGGILGPLGFAVAILVSTPGFFQSTPMEAADQLKDFALSFLFLWCFYQFAKRGVDVNRVFRGAVLILAVFCVITVVNALTGTPSWTSPFDNYPVALHLTGFNAKRTGWSNGLALFFPLTLLFLYSGSGQRTTWGARFLFLFATMSIVASQVVCGGRAGLLASLSSGVFLTLFSPARKVMGMLILIAAGIAFAMSDYLFEQLRLYHLVVTQVSTNTLDSFSAGRVAGYSVALELIAQRPLSGYGFGEVEMMQFGIQYKEVHNVWLRLAVEAGVLLPLFFFGFLITLIARLKRLFRIQDRSRRITVFAFSAVVFNGVLISFFEPNVLIGTFQNSAAWWAVAGCLLGFASTESRLKYKRLVTEDAERP